MFRFPLPYRRRSVIVLLVAAPLLLTSVFGLLLSPVMLQAAPADQATTPTLDLTTTPSPSPLATLTLTPTLQPTVGPTDTSTPQFTATVVVTETPTGTETLAPTATLTPTASTTPTSAPTATVIPPAPGDVLINELQYDPPQPGAEAPWEWIELYNRTDHYVNLAGWILADNIGSDPLPGVTIPPGKFLVVAAMPAFRVNFPDFSGIIVFIADGVLGNGLANAGDRLILRAPGGLVVDALSWGDDATVLAPPCLTVPAGHSLERMPFGQDTDSAADFGDQAHPSPGVGVLAPTPTPLPTPYPATAWLNEFLPAPRGVDWDGDGQATNNDEWIELYNAGAEPVELQGWQLDDQEGGSRPYVIPAGVSIAPGGFLVFYKRDTGVSLNDAGDEVRLLRPDGTIADQYAYSTHPGYDRSYSRTSDGGGGWTETYPPSPGTSNQPPPTPEPTRRPSTPAPPPGPRQASIAEARSLPAGTQVTVEGVVSVPPGVLSAVAFYFQDTTAGVRVYVRHGEPPELALGERVRVTGKMGSFHGEIEVRVEGPEQVERLGPGEPPSPTAIGTGEVGPAYEGMLVSVVGRVVGFYKHTLDLDDGSGACRVVFREMTGVRRPWVEMGEVWQVMGVVGRVSSGGGALGPQRVFPRFGGDVSPSPAGLPVTGGPAGGSTTVAGLACGLMAAGAAILARARRRSA